MDLSHSLAKFEAENWLPSQDPKRNLQRIWDMWREQYPARPDPVTIDTTKVNPQLIHQWIRNNPHLNAKPTTSGNAGDYWKDKNYHFQSER